MPKNNRSWAWPVRVSGVVALVVTILLLTLFPLGRQKRPWPHASDREKPFEQDKRPPPHQDGLKGHIEHYEEIATWTPPAGMRVIGLVFYGRRRFVTILNCYLQVC